MRHQILITGIGGQGVLFLSKVLQSAALIQGEKVFSYEIHGMSQRGGSVYTSLKVGDFHSPQLFPGEVDTLLALDADNALPYLQYLKPGSFLAVNASRLGEEEKTWLSQQGFRCLFIDADAKAMALKNPKAANLVMLGGVLATETFPIRRPAVEEALRRSVKPAFLEANLQALV